MKQFDHITEIDSDTLRLMAEDLKVRGIFGVIDNMHQMPNFWELIRQALHFVADHKENTPA